MSFLRVAIFGSFVSAILFLCIFYAEGFVVTAVYGLTIFYTLWAAYHVTITIAGSSMPSADIDYKSLEKHLPKISLIIPARSEPILSRTIDVCLNHTDYPLEKKEIVVVVDDPDGERIAFWYQQKYPQNVKLLSRRKAYPTKPSALNDSIHLCSGEIVGIVDVEDIPERDVFLRAAHALTQQGRVVTQAILRISNADDSWISRVFSMEYAGWFRILLNGRSKLGLYSPLGGTGNYFKKSSLSHVGLYDATNLAEDAELSIRLLIAGWKVGVLNARHWEEAPVTFGAWVKQRTRWNRGWLQSLWKYIPVLFDIRHFRRLGIMGTLSTLMMLVGPLIVMLSLVAYGITFLWLLESAGLVSPIMTKISYPFWMAIPISFNIIYYYVWLKGAKLEGLKIKAIQQLPYMVFYMNVMMPIAALRAMYQEIFKPVMWEKTTHEGRGVMNHTLTG